MVALLLVLYLLTGMVLALLAAPTPLVVAAGVTTTFWIVGRFGRRLPFLFVLFYRLVPDRRGAVERAVQGFFGGLTGDVGAVLDAASTRDEVTTTSFSTALGIAALGLSAYVVFGAGQFDLLQEFWATVVVWLPRLLN